MSSCSALVLFDEDGCTAIVDSKKFVDVSKPLQKGQRLQMKYGNRKQTYLVEILELSESALFLNDYENEWSLSHRSIALDIEKRRRGENQPNGFLDVWPKDQEDLVLPKDPADVSDVSTLSASDEEVTKNVDEEPHQPNLPDEPDTTDTTAQNDEPISTAVTKIPTPKAKSPTNKKDTTPKEKITAPNQTTVMTGLKGRQINVLHIGSMDEHEKCKPLRKPFMLDDLNCDERDLVQLQIEETQLDRCSRSTQTDKVVVIGPEDELPTGSSAPCTCTVKLDKVFSAAGKKMDYIVRLLKEIHSDKLVEILMLLNRISDTTQTGALQNILLSGLSEDLTELQPVRTSDDPCSRPCTPDSKTVDSEAKSSSPTPSALNTVSTLHTASLQELTPMSANTVCTLAAVSVQELTPTSVNTMTSFTATSATAISDLTTINATQLGKSPSVTSLQVTETPRRISPAITDGQSQRPRLSSKLICRPGIVAEISSHTDMMGIPPDAEVRIRQAKVLEILDRACSKGNFAWHLCQEVFSTDELIGRNYYGAKGKPALSPRRVHALEHAVSENYGFSVEFMREVTRAINTGIRNLKNRSAPRRPLFTGTENS